jgi:two-component system, chemotaxis family, sensor kinase CheA
VIEKLNDPMVHLIRNAIDHGIESPAERVKLGKPRQGNILLSAVHSGAFVLIQIIDDGAGLDKNAIFRKAVEKGLIMSDAVLSEKEIFSFLFAPGFSTAKVVTNVSGRGVGMDVVKKNIDALQGSVEMSSKTGEGTTVTLKIPLTLAIIDGLLTRISDTFFVIPLSAIEECIELTCEDAEKSHGQNFINIRGEIVPYIHLRKRFGIGGKRPDIEQIAITRYDNNRIGLVIDEVIGEHQTVIKKLGRLYRHVEEVSGATILGNGTVALILDLPRLIAKTQMEEKNALCERLIN